MKASFLAVSIFIFVNSSFAQSNFNDHGTGDTIALHISNPPDEGTRVGLKVEVWVYSDETVLSFSAGFKWNNTLMRIDSARVSPLLKSPDFSIFLYENDDFSTSNTDHIFVLGGFTIGSGLAGDISGRRLWATYYFTLASWHQGDSIVIDLLPDDQMELAFVSPGPFYPVSFKPHFEGPLRCPSLATSVIEDEHVFPSDFILHQNYPNPFNPDTKIEFELSARTQVDLEIFNIMGEKVTDLLHASLPAGRHSVTWNSITNGSTVAPSGVYFYRLRTSLYSESKKMLLLK